MVKKREKEYSFEEAMHIARQAALPNWYFSEPYFYGAANEDGTTYPQPLSDELTSKTWCIFYCSLTGWTFQRTLQTYLEWIRRFQILGIRFIFVFRERFPILIGRLATEDWLTRHQLKGSVACDLDGQMNRAFGEESYPRLVILHEGEISFNSSGHQWLDSAEKELHRILRIESPGLPFLLPWSEKEKYPEEKGFVSVSHLGELTNNHSFKVEGRWHLEHDHIWTQDHTATLEMTTQYSDVGVVAQSMTEGSSSTRINVVSTLGAIPEQYAGKDSTLDSDSTLTTSVHFVRTYFLLKKLPSSHRKLLFRFPLAHEVPVKIFGFEFAEHSV